MYSNTPIISKLKQYAKKKRVSFAMPGHKAGKGFYKSFKKNIPLYDVTELPDTPNLHNPDTAVRDAQQFAAEFFGSSASYFLTGGSTSGIYAMLASVASYGDTVVINRAAHMSVINACVMLGLKPAFVEQGILDTFSVPTGVNQTDLIRVLDENPDAKAVLITSPSYYGICSDLETIVKITRGRGIPLLVDEAHGAHFAVSESIFPGTAMSLGADMAVQSAHKTLNALNQAAYLHFKSDFVNKRRLESVLAMVQTSSPSYPIIASADMARAELTTAQGRNRWRVTYNNCEHLKEIISASTKVEFISTMLKGKYNIEDIDPTRLVMNFSAYKITGFEVADILCERYNIDVEMADLFNVVAIATPSNSAMDFARLSRAVVKICSELKSSDEEPAFPPIPIPEQAMLPQDAFYSKTKKLRLEDAVGEVAAATILAYPPATPIICVGERISEESVSYLLVLQSLNADIVGLENSYVSVVDTEEYTPDINEVYEKIHKKDNADNEEALENTGEGAKDIPLDDIDDFDDYSDIDDYDSDSNVEPVYYENNTDD